jgi:hypothetical protein
MLKVNKKANENDLYGSLNIAGSLSPTYFAKPEPVRPWKFKHKDDADESKIESLRQNQLEMDFLKQRIKDKKLKEKEARLLAYKLSKYTSKMATSNKPTQTFEGINFIATTKPNL